MNAQMEELKSSFAAESDRLLNKAEECILILEKEFSESCFDELFRAIHTIKGNSGLFEAPDLGRLAHAFETALSRSRAGGRAFPQEVVELLLLSVDRLRRLVRSIGSVERIDVEDLIGAFDRELGHDASIPAGTDGRAAVPTGSRAGRSEPARQAPNADPAKGKIQLSPEVRKIAQSKGQHLYVAVFDPVQHGMDSVKSVADWAAVLSSEGSLRQMSMAPYGNGGPPAVLCGAVFMTKEEPHVFLQSKGIRARRIQTLHSPDAAGGSRNPSFDGNVPPAHPRTQILADNPAAEHGNTPSVPGSPASSQDAVNALRSNGSGNGPSNVDDSHLRVPVELIDNLINLAGEAVVARNELLQRVEKLGDHAIMSAGKRVSQIVTRLQEGIMRTRLQSLQTVFLRLPRIMRDAVMSTGKKAQLSLEGREVELDKSLIETIGEALIHLVRNSVDHGIENPDERVRIGKNPEGSVQISAVLLAGNVSITVRDDGRGLDLERIKTTAVARGMISAEQAGRLTETEAADLIFMPGLSTAETITSTSGRGVGMDAVRSAVKKCGGSITVSTKAGHGTTFSIVVPQTLSITTCLLVRIGGQRYALPQQEIQELIALDPALLRDSSGHLMYELRGSLLSVIALADALQSKGRSVAENPFIAVVRTDRYRFGLSIEEIINPEEIVVRPLSDQTNVDLFSGAAIMGDGEAVLVLDVGGIARTMGIQAAAESGDGKVSARAASMNEEKEHLLFQASSRSFAIDLAQSPKIISVSPEQLNNVLEHAVVQLGSEIIPVRILERAFNFPEDDREEVFLILMRRNGVPTAIAASRITGVVPLGRPDSRAVTNKGVLGCVTYGETMALVLDPDWIHDSDTKSRSVAGVEV